STPPSSPTWLAVGAAIMGVLFGGAAVYLGLQLPDGHRLGAAVGRTVEASATEQPSAQPSEAMPQREARSDLVSAVARTQDSVVNLQTAAGLGAGVIVDERGIIVTNFHVIADALNSPS